MKNTPDDWIDVEPQEEKIDEEIIWVSKSEIKRDAETLKRLGTELTTLSDHSLDRIPLDEDLRNAINLARRISREGRRRQLQLIGKLLRARDTDVIYQALDKLRNRHNQQTALLHKIEKLRDQLVEGDDAFAAVISLYPNADRQQLRNLVRNARKEKIENKPPKAYRQIFQYLRTLSEQG